MTGLAKDRAREPCDERSATKCMLCGGRTATLHDHMHDQLHGAPGEWRLVRCLSRSCGLVQLDPAPDEGTTALAYENYHTHFVGGTEEETRFDGGWLRSLLHHVNALLLRLTGVRAEKRRVELSYLGGVDRGRLLDVGCGNGNRLAGLRDLGWEVVGQEVDPRAAEVARRVFDIPVLVGPLAELALADVSFDAVVMNHVIEHVREPVGLLRESWRLVKPGGSLVCLTPNVAGIGHAFFGPRWRGLEPPRHLYLFSRRSLAIVARRAGIANFRCWTTAANTINLAFESMASAEVGPGQSTRRGDLRRRSLAALVQLLASVAHPFLPSSGDECVLWADK